MLIVKEKTMPDDEIIHDEPAKEVPNLSGMRLKLIGFEDLKMEKAADIEKAQDWGDRMRQVKKYIGTLNDNDISKIDPNAWHLIMASCAKLYDVDIVEGVETPADSIGYLQMLEDHIFDRTKKPISKEPQARYPTTDIETYVRDSWMKMKGSSMIPEAKQRVEQSLDAKPLFISINSKGVLFGMTEYILASSILKERVEAGSYSNDEEKTLAKIAAQDTFAQTFAYANLVDLGKNNPLSDKRKPKDKPESEVDVKILPAGNFERKVDHILANLNNPTVEPLTFLIEDDASTGSTINDTLEGMKRKILKKTGGDVAAAGKFFMHLRINIGSITILKSKLIHKQRDVPENTIVWDEQLGNFQGVNLGYKGKFFVELEEPKDE